MATVLAALLLLAPVLVGCSSTSQGTATHPDGSTYTGEWKDGKRHGQGTHTNAEGETYTDERRYRGEWKNNKRHGQGTLTLADGTKRTGEWKDNKPVPLSWRVWCCCLCW